MFFRPWLQLLRLPNLPTALCDAVAGGVYALCLLSPNPAGLFPEGAIRFLIGAGFCELFLYAFGLIDNDIIGVKEDAVSRADRPIPSGKISLSYAKLARTLCLFFAVILAEMLSLPFRWWISALLLTACIASYNRLKSRMPQGALVLMALCRAGAVLSGMCALPLSLDTFATLRSLWLTLPLFAWILFIWSVSFLALREDAPVPSGLLKIGFPRYLGAVAVLFAAASLIPLVSTVSRYLLLVLFLLLLFTTSRWIVLVRDLDTPAATTQMRRTAVGATIRLLLPLQSCFVLLLLPDSPALFLLLLLCWCASFLIRKKAPAISGS